MCPLGAAHEADSFPADDAQSGPDAVYGGNWVLGGALRLFVSAFNVDVDVGVAGSKRWWIGQIFGAGVQLAGTLGGDRDARRKAVTCL